jgi:hypothetical protein
MRARKSVNVGKVKNEIHVFLLMLQRRQKVHEGTKYKISALSLTSSAIPPNKLFESE